MFYTVLLPLRALLGCLLPGRLALAKRAVRKGKLLLVALPVIALVACSEETGSSPMAGAATGKTTALAQAQPSSSVSGIFINGVSLQKVRTLGWSPSHTAKYEAAAKRFPTAEACLLSDPARAPSLAIDWRKVGSDIEAEVCLSRVASTIGTAKGMIAWLQAHDFAAVSVRSANDIDTSSEAAERAGTVIEGQWSIEDNGPLYRRGLVSPLRQRLFGHGATVVIFISKTHKNVSVRSGVTYL